MAKLRTIVEGSKFATQAQEYGSVERMDEILEGVKTALAKKPELVGEPTKFPNVWYVVTRPWNTESFVIFYSFDSERVCLEGIIRSDDSDSDS